MLIHSAMWAFLIILFTVLWFVEFQVRLQIMHKDSHTCITANDLNVTDENVI